MQAIRKEKVYASIITFSGNKLTQFCPFIKAKNDFWNKAEGFHGARFSSDIDAAGRVRTSDPDSDPRVSGYHEKQFNKYPLFFSNWRLSSCH